MSVVIERKMSKIAEKMAKMQQELAALEAQKANKLNIDNDDIRQLANQVRQLSQKSGENMNNIIQLVAKSAGIKLSKIATSKRAKSDKVVAIKYRDPANADNTWTGRGIAPRWLQTYIANGRRREEFMV